jgi:hypothetical protein
MTTYPLFHYPARTNLGEIVMPPTPQQDVQHAPVIDPDNVPEILCDGQFNLAIAGHLAMLTFTHARPDATQMFANGTLVSTAIVQARIVITMENLIALRDFLNTRVQSIEAARQTAPATGGSTKH